MLPIANFGNWAIIEGMDDQARTKVFAALQEAADEVNRRGTMLLPEMIEFIALYLLNHPDADVRAFQQQAERNCRKDLN